jgi:hypothetical protein
MGPCPLRCVTIFGSPFVSSCYHLLVVVTSSVLHLLVSVLHLSFVELLLQFSIC